MKRFSLLLIGLFAFAATTFAQEETKAGFVTFEKDVHDFGQITDEQDAVTSFTFTNTSGQALVLNPPKTSCGCTTPSYPKEPIAAGATETIDVKYSTKGRIGKFIKDVRVYAQGYEDPIIIKITGEVVSPQAVSTLPKKQGNSLFK